MNILGFHWTCATFIDFPRYTATVHNAKKYFARLGWRSRRHEEIWRIQCCHLISGRSYHRRSCQVSVPPMLLDPDVAQFWEAQVLSSSCDLVLVRLSFLDSNFACPRTSSNIFFDASHGPGGPTCAGTFCSNESTALRRRTAAVVGPWGKRSPNGVTNSIADTSETKTLNIFEPFRKTADNSW